MAEIAEVGFDTFMETEKGFEAFVEEEKFDSNHLQSVKEKYNHVNPLIFFQDKIQKQNWNEEWEKSIEPIIVDDKCLVRAEFHKMDKKYPYEIVITSGSPQQKIGVIPLAKALSTLVANSFPSSPKYCLRSLCPIITYGMPIDFNIGAETSPV